MASERTLSEWNRVSLEIAARAFKYAQLFGSPELPEASSGYLQFTNLQRLHACSKPPEGAWWWIFTPFLKQLLEGSESTAILVALGHHTWIGPDPHNYRREWFGFLSQDFEKKENLDSLVDICNYTALQTSIPEFARDDVLLTSVLLERLNEYGGAKEHMEKHSAWPLLQPLLCDFTNVETEPAIGDKWPMLITNWGELWRTIGSISKSLPPPNSDLYPITRGDVERALNDSSAFFAPRIPSTAKPLTAGAFYKSYKAILDARLRKFYESEAAKEGNLDQAILGQQRNPTNLNAWVSHLSRESNIRDRLLRTAMWFHDFTGDPLSKGKPQMGYLLSSPVWLPPPISNTATISMVAYLRKGSFPSSGDHGAVEEAAAIANTFRSGSSVTLKNVGTVSGILTGETKVLHHLPKDMWTLNDELQKHKAKLDALRTQYPHLNIPSFLMPDALSVMMMFLKAQYERELYELPSDCAEMLQEECTQLVMNEFVKRVVWEAAWRRVVAEEKVKERRQAGTLTWSGIVDMERKFQKPELIIRQSFRVIRPHGLYPLLLVTLRSAFQHAFLHTLLDDHHCGGKVEIQHEAKTEEESITITNTGRADENASQRGWTTDLEIFQPLTHWRVIDQGSRAFSKLDGKINRWVTKLVRLKGV